MLKTDYANTRKKLDFTPSHRQWLHDSIINAILGFISCFLLFKQSPLANIASFPFTCLFFFRNFSLMHEAVHHTAHPNRKLNEVTGTLTGIFCFLEYTLWKEMHIKHHYWTGNLQQDPVLALIRFYNSRTKRIQKFFDVSWKLGIPLVAFAQHVVFWTQSFLIARKSNSTFLSLLKTTLPLFCYLIFAAQLSPLALGSFLASITVYLSGVEIINLPHHVGLYTDTAEQRIPIWEQDQYSRSCKYPEFIEKYFVLNFNYHVEHHLFPDLPWFQLPKAHRLVLEANGERHPSLAENGWVKKKRAAEFGVFLGTNERTSERAA